ncbi:MAG TPA: right-handed parallel beta-helix repeat-containing protein, partial [Myxococcota bacterium]|nr:right-handed parallel beta-helix repeat-containing protein [Myxococcota bacterium]
SAWYGHGGMGYLETGAQLHLDNDSFTSISLPFASTGYDGGLIYAEGGAALETIAITVEAANARTGGMIYLDDQGTWSDEASNLYDASALGNGGLLYAGDNTVITLTDTFVSLPVAAGANGGAFYGGTGVRFTGSGLYISGATASNGSSTGGAIYLDSSHDLSLRDCTIEDSSAWGSPAIYAYQGASLQIDGCTLRNNVATGSNYASAIFLNNPTGDMSISSSSFSGNTGAVTTSGGANPVATLSLRDCLFESNSSDRAAVSTEHNLSLSDSQFLDNSGDNGSSNTPGGALFVSGGNTAITDCRFEGNSAYEGAAIYADEPTSFILSGTHFDANRMTNAGGGLLLYHPTSATIYNNWFCNNGSDSSSTSGGGAH